MTVFYHNLAIYLIQLQVEAFRAWVGDLVGQNTLLARAVEELERDATSRLLLERTRHTEVCLLHYRPQEILMIVLRCLSSSISHINYCLVLCCQDICRDLEDNSRYVLSVSMLYP